ncbi:MAG: TrmH family RNA methyltransferase, partial [Bacteroidetes bacterium]
ILRTADWFGFRHIICSPDSVDVFNPKVVQSTMGAIARVRVHYIELAGFLSGTKDRPVYGTFLEGESLYETEMDPNPVILFGNESRGLSGDYEPFLDKKISIPSFSGTENGPESLNLASAVAIFCSEIRRRNL